MNISLIFIITHILVTVIVCMLSRKLHFYDIPDPRKIHKEKILNTMGISIYISLSLVIVSLELSSKIETIIVIGFSLVMIGFLDDRKNFKPTTKLILTFFPIVYLFFNGFILSDLGEYELLGKLNLGKFGIVFSFLAVGLLMNSFNYADGIDGLLLSITISGLYYLNFLVESESVNRLLDLIILILIISLFFNLLPVKNKFKSFLGDGGSLFIGFFMSFLLIYLYKYDKIHPSFLIWSCWYPAYDFLYVTINRIIKKKKFYIPDQMHFHHFIIRKYKLTQFKALIIISAINLFTIILGYNSALKFGYVFSLGLFFSLFFILSFIRSFLKN